MKKIEIIEWNLKPGPIKVEYYLTIIDTEKCAKSALSVLQSAVSDKNKRIPVDKSYPLQNAKDQLKLLELCGCKVKVVDVVS
jgi:hypothetical protein